MVQLNSLILDNQELVINLDLIDNIDIKNGLKTLVIDLTEKVEFDSELEELNEIDSIMASRRENREYSAPLNVQLKSANYFYKYGIPQTSEEFLETLQKIFNLFELNIEYYKVDLIFKITIEYENGIFNQVISKYVDINKILKYIYYEKFESNYNSDGIDSYELFYIKKMYFIFIGYRSKIWVRGVEKFLVASRVEELIEEISENKELTIKHLQLEGTIKGNIGISLSRLVSENIMLNQRELFFFMMIIEIKHYGRGKSESDEETNDKFSEKEAIWEFFDYLKDRFDTFESNQKDTFKNRSFDGLDLVNKVRKKGKSYEIPITAAPIYTAFILNKGASFRKRAIDFKFDESYQLSYKEALEIFEIAIQTFFNFSFKNFTQELIGDFKDEESKVKFTEISYEFPERDIIELALSLEAKLTATKRLYNQEELNNALNSYSESVKNSYFFELDDDLKVKKLALENYAYSIKKKSQTLNKEVEKILESILIPRIIDVIETDFFDTSDVYLYSNKSYSKLASKIAPFDINTRIDVVKTILTEIDKNLEQVITQAIDKYFNENPS